MTRGTATKLAGLCLGAFMCCLFFAPATGKAAAEAQDYIVRPEAYRDNYILTQLFYSAFSVDDLEAIQHVVSQGMLAYPDDFPRFMSLTLELLKKQDARLFMLLAPIAPYVADKANPAEFESVVRLTDIISGRVLPGGGQPEEPSLKSRIKFYEDSSRVVRRPVPAQPAAPVAPPVPGEKEAQDPAPGAPAYIAGDGETFSFTRMNDGESPASSEFIWTRAGSAERKLNSRAVSSLLPDGALWGGVYTDFAGQSVTKLAFFIVKDGIINFALPSGINEGNFYADEEARPHQSNELGAELFSRRADGALPRPCEMRVVISPRDDAMPPELAVSLEQTNAGRGSSDFICRPQCVLSYSWAGEGYVLSGKSCVQSGWGIWPYSEERYRQPINTRTR